jgi:peptidoglycan/xylan/chitin deacetylase (PgdA/CDA1 family)
MIRANDAIARLCGRRAQGYRSPAWDLSPHTLELLIQHGFYYESSMMGHDHSPYRVRQGDVIELQKPMQFGDKTPLIEMPISWSQDDHPHFEMTSTRRNSCAWTMPPKLTMSGTPIHKTVVDQRSNRRESRASASCQLPYPR